MVKKNNRFGRQANKSSQKAKSPTRSRLQSILVVCEGETGQIYLDAWKQKLGNKRSANVKVVPKGGLHSKTIEKAKVQRDAQAKKAERSNGRVAPYDQIWCVFDVENLLKHGDGENFKTAVKSAKEEDFYIAVASPSIEVWYLWHFEKATGYLPNGTAAKQKLKKHIPDYDEKKNVFPILESRLESALDVYRGVANQIDLNNPDRMSFSQMPVLLCRAFWNNRLIFDEDTQDDQCVSCHYRIDLAQFKPDPSNCCSQCRLRDV